jgi:ubiquinone/menaquinone biosynthesis C-methylase UbiE
LERSSSAGVPSVLYDKEYFLHVCEGYREFISGEGEYLSRRLIEALSVAGVAPGMKVLDVGCGRGEILLHTARLGARAYGIDYATVAVQLSRQVVTQNDATVEPIGVYQANAQTLPFYDNVFDRILMLDIVEHLYDAELEHAFAEVWRVLKPGGRVIVHTAPNVWYDRYAYPLVRAVRCLMGQGQQYPKNPRALIPANLNVHVNEQSMLSLRQHLLRAGFHNLRVWVSSPPQYREENILFKAARWFLFGFPPFSWFFEREVFAVGDK